MNENKKEMFVLRYILERKAKEQRDEIFTYWDDKVITYGQMDEISNQAANGFLELGVKKNDRVLIFMPNCIEYIYAWCGINKIGAIEVLVNNAYKGNMLKYILNNAEAEILVVHQRLLDRVHVVQDELEHVKRLVVVTDDGGLPELPLNLRFEAVTFSKLMKSSSSPTPDPDIKHYDIMAIIYTSGTTGPSKGVLVTYAQVYASWAPIVDSYDSDDIFYNPFPLFHASGQYFYYAMMIVGGAVVGREVFSMSSFWDDIDKYKATCTLLLSSMVPFVYNHNPRAMMTRKIHLKKSPWYPLLTK